MNETKREERAILVGVAVGGAARVRVEEYLEELSLLASSAGAVVTHRLIQERHAIDAAFFIGSGKAEELGYLVDQHKIDLVIFDDDLSAVQRRNLEKVIKCKIVDRS